ncbi:MAG: tetratricopeptide repeat protein [Bacteroidia bacterium]
MEEQILFEKIDDYLSDQLPPAERLAFEKELANNPAWQEILHQHEEMDRYLNDPVAKKLEEGLFKLKQEAKAPKSRRIPLLAYTSVAIIALLILFVWGIGRLQPKADIEMMAAAEFEPYPTYLNLRGQNSDTSKQNQTINGLLLYEKGQYDEALAVLQQVQIDSQQVRVDFYLGNIYLARKNTSAAIAAFETVLAQGDHLFVPQTQWYLALAYLQTPSSQAKGIAFLEEVAKTETEFALKAQALLEQIK